MANKAIKQLMEDIKKSLDMPDISEEEVERMLEGASITYIPEEKENGRT